MGKEALILNPEVGNELNTKLLNSGLTGDNIAKQLDS